MPPTNEEIETAVREAEALVNRALPPGGVTFIPERSEFRARAFTDPAGQ